LGSEKNSRGVFLIYRLASAFSPTEGKGAELIPLLFNSLFRDGRTSKEEFEYTPSFADDVSKFAYSIITSTLEKVKADYRPLNQDGTLGIPHEQQVDHLAKWLIANWPGCENFTLSDQNVPAILAANSSTKRISSQSKSPTEENANPTDETSKVSWPLIAAVLLLLGSLAYWGKKRFAS